MSRVMTSSNPILEQPLAAVSTAALVELFAAGAKATDRWRLGLEIELFPLEIGAPKAVEYPRVGRIFEALGERKHLRKEREPQGAIVGLKGDGYSFSLEPGGQIELASRPYRGLARLKNAVVQLVAELAEVARQEGVRLIALGHHPYATTEDVPRMPKARYDVMRAYLPRRGRRGLEMMHLTGSVQCAVDFSDEANLVDKVRTAARASPFLAALTAASPFSGGRPNGMRSMRYAIWRDVDPDRCGIWPEMLDEVGLTYERYVRRALATPAMLFVRDGGYRIAEPRPFESFAATGFEGTPVTVADFVDHLTTLFPEIRTKNYVELRGSDCVLPAEAVAIAGFWRGLLDHPPARAEVAARLGSLDHPAILQLQEDVARAGLDAGSPIGPVREIARWLVELAHRSLGEGAPDCADCMAPLLERAAKGRSPADDLLAIAERDGVEAALATVTA